MANLNIMGIVSADLTELRGEQGVQGIQGERGLQGDQGITGLKGDKGDPGVVNLFQYETSAELVTALDMYTQAQVNVYSIQLPNLNKGAILSLSAQFEATNPYTYNCMLGRYLLLKDATHIAYITKPCTSNISPNMHHCTVSIARNYKLASNFVSPVLSLVAYAGASMPVSGHKLVIEQGYGHLDILTINN